MESFSQRELEILGLLAEGLTNRQIGQRLFISAETVKWYNKQIYGKLGAGSRTQAVTIAREQGLFDEGREQVEAVTAPHPPKHNLPAPVTTFIGRQRQIIEVMDLLDKARLVTLTGPGGTGKTRLSQQVAAGMTERYPGGTTFVPLALVDAPELVPGAVANALGVTERANEELVDTLGRSLRGKEMLLLLDNYEHLLAAAPLASKLLAAAPGLSVMVTSREVLRLNGEHEYPVPPLEVPDATSTRSLSDLAASESVTLFVQRAQAAQPTFRLTEDNAGSVAGICKRLDGLPLAIELAAARIRIFSPQQLLERLESRLNMLTGGSRDLPARQQTLRSAIDWSYQLLNEGEQTFFARMGVFSGGRSIDAIEAVCGPGLSLDALDGLESLVNKSLLFQVEGPNGEPRFAMLATIHEFARERLAQSGEMPLIRDRHLAYFLSLAEEMEPGYRRHNHLLFLERTEAEMGNFRLAINWAFEKADFEAAARLVSAIYYFLYYRDRFVEGYHWASRLLKYRDDMEPETRIKLFIAAGNLASANWETSFEEHYCREALVQAQKIGDRVNQAWAHTFLGGAAIGRPEAYAEGVEQAEAGLAIFRELKDQSGMAQALNILGELARTAGDYSRAREVYEECLVISQESGEVIRQAMSNGNLAYVAFHEGDFQRARNFNALHLRQMVELGAKQATADGLAGSAGPLARLGEPIKAARLLGAANALLNGMGIDHQMGDQLEFDLYTAEVRAMLDEATFDAAFAEGQAMNLDAAVAYALEGLE